MVGLAGSVWLDTQSQYCGIDDTLLQQQKMHQINNWMILYTRGDAFNGVVNIGWFGWQCVVEYLISIYYDLNWYFYCYFDCNCNCDFDFYLDCDMNGSYQIRDDRLWFNCNLNWNFDLYLYFNSNSDYDLDSDVDCRTTVAILILIVISVVILILILIWMAICIVI